MRSEAPKDLKALWPLYLGEWFVLLAVTVGVGGFAGEGFPYLSFILAGLLAVSVGLLLRCLKVENEVAIYLLLFLGVAVWFFRPLRETLLTQVDVLGNGQDFGVGLSVAFLCLSIGLASVATTDGVVAFVIVPGLSAFGTSADVATAPNSFLTAFLLFIFSSVFILAYQHILTKTARRAIHVEAPESARRALLFASLFSFILFLSAHAFTTVAKHSVSSLGSTALIGPGNARLPRLALGLSFPRGRPLELGTIPPPPSQRTAFSVRSDTQRLWRVGVYNNYDGRTWTVVPPFRPVEVPSPENFSGLAPDLPAKGKPVRQSYTIQGLTSDAVIAAATPVGLRGIDGAVRVDAFGCVTGEVPTRPGAAYGVISYVAEPSAQDFRQASTQYPGPDAELYLRRPQSTYMSERIARQVAGNAPTDFDKVVALQRYLEQNFTYTLNPPPVPRGRDFVTWFLTDSKAGYCEAFASALVVMARSLGIPARLATGFASGEFHPETSTFQVQEKDAHAWAEIYFGRDLGWIAFDPQPIKQEMTVPSSLNLRRLLQVPRQLIVARGPFVVTALVLLCALLLLAGPLAFRVLTYRLPSPLASRDDRDRICQTYAALCSSFATLGLARLPSQTASEYLAHLSSRLRFTSLDVLTPLRQVTDLFLLACYSTMPVGPSHVQAAVSALETIRRSARRLRTRH